MHDPTGREAQASRLFSFQENDMSRTLPFALVLAATLAVTGCAAGDAPADGERSGFAGLANKAADKIRDEIANEDMDLGRGNDKLPAAKLSPQGDLLIGGEEVAMTEEQRAIALAYRQALGNVAETGARLGLQGAALAGDALKLAAANVLSGKGPAVEEQIKDKTQAIEAEAKALCEMLPNLLEQQQRFAAAVPEFAPYANMTQEDVDKCGDGNVSI